MYFVIMPFSWAIFFVVVLCVCVKVCLSLRGRNPLCCRLHKQKICSLFPWKQACIQPCISPHTFDKMQLRFVKLLCQSSYLLRTRSPPLTSSNASPPLPFCLLLHPWLKKKSTSAPLNSKSPSLFLPALLSHYPSFCPPSDQIRHCDG